jgi:hypothetical protein
MPLDQVVDRVVPYQPEERSRLLLRIRKWETLRVVGKEYSQRRSPGFLAKLSVARLSLKIGAVRERTVRRKERWAQKIVQGARRRADSTCAHQYCGRRSRFCQLPRRHCDGTRRTDPVRSSIGQLPRKNGAMPKADRLRHVLDRCLSLALTCGEVFCLGSRSRSQWLQLISMQGWRQ